MYFSTSIALVAAETKLAISVANFIRLLVKQTRQSNTKIQLENKSVPAAISSFNSSSIKSKEVNSFGLKPHYHCI